MATKEMKTLTIGLNTYEVVDEAARTAIEELSKTGSGADNISYVNFTVNEDLSVVTSDKSVTEIITAHTNGRLVIGLAVTSDGSTLVIPITMTTDDAVVFSIVYGQGTITISGMDGSSLELEDDVWDILVITLTSSEEVDKKIAEAIGDVETLLQSI